MTSRTSGATFGLTEVTDLAHDSSPDVEAKKASAPIAHKPTGLGDVADGSGAVDGGMAMDIMMLLDTAEVLALKKEFEKQEDGLTCAQFVYVMQRFLSKTDTASALEDVQLVSNLCELFLQIDVNGDGTMEWEEFTSFIVETGKQREEHEPNSIQMYHPIPWEDTNKHNTFMERVYYFPATDKIAACEHGSKLLKIYTPHCEPLKAIRRTEGIVLCADHIPSLSQYVLSSSDLQISFYDDQSHRLYREFPTPSSQMCMTWAESASTLFSAGVSGVVYAWDPDPARGGDDGTGHERFRMGGPDRDGRLVPQSHEDMVLDLLYIGSLERLASASMDHKIMLWDMHTGQHKKTLEGHSKGVRSLAYSPGSRFLFSAGFDYDCLVWNPYVEQIITHLYGHSASLCNVEVIPNTTQIITADITGVFKVWDSRSWECMQTFTPTNGDQTTMRDFVSVTPHKRLVAAGRRFHIFDYEKLENPELTDDSPVFKALFNPTSMTFITAAGRDVKIWDARKGILLKHFRNLCTTDLTSLCLDDRERKFIVGDHEGNIRVYDYLNGAEMKGFNYAEQNGRAHAGEVSTLIYGNHDKVVISASWDQSVIVHDEMDPEEGLMLRKMQGGHRSDITCAAYSYNLSLIASGSSDAMLQVWDYEFARIEGTCVGHTSTITAMAFIDPYPGLITADNNGNIVLWAVRPAPAHLKYKVLLRFQNKARHSDSVSPVLVLAVKCRWSSSHNNSAEASTDEFRSSGAETKDDFVPNVDGGYSAPSSGGSATFSRRRSSQLHMGVGPSSATDEGKRAGNANGVANRGSGGLRGLLRGSKISRGNVVEDYDVFAGDEKGNIKLVHWRLGGVLDSLHAQGFVPMRNPYECENPRRNLRLDASDVVNKQQGPEGKVEDDRGIKNERANSFHFVEDPLVTAAGAKLVSSWRAHTDAIFSLQLIDEPPSLLSSSFDRLVRIFSLTGELLGTLRQGDEFAGLNWKFRMDFEARLREKEDFAKQVIEEIEADDFEDGFDGSGSEGDGNSDAESENYDVLRDFILSDQAQDRLASSYAGSSSYRRTPRLRPVNPRSAGRGMSITPRGRKLRERPRLKSKD